MAKLKDETVQGDLLVMGNLTVAGEINDGDLTSIINTSTYGQDRMIRLYPKGVANEQVAINAAIVTLGTAGGGILHLVQGPWYINGTITVEYNNVIIEGEGKSTLIIQSGDYDSIFIHGSVGGGPVIGGGVRNLAIRYATNRLKNAINLNYCSSCVVENVYCIDQGCFIYSINSTDITILNVFHYPLGGTDKAYSSIYFFNVSGSIKLLTCIGDGVQITSGGGDVGGIIISGMYGGGQVSIENCSIYNVKSNSSEFYGIHLHSASRCSISNTLISDISGHANVCGCYISTSTHAKIIGLVCNNTVTGIRIDDSPTDYAEIIGCTVIGCSTYGIVNALSGNDYCRFIDNKCYNNGSDTTVVNTGYNFSDSGTNTQVWGNSWQCIGGVWDVGPTISTDKVQARSSAGLSLFEDGGKGIYVQDSTGYVGIGTASPATRLEVGDSYNQQTIRVSGGSAANKSPVLSILKSGIAEYDWWINTSGTFMLSTNPPGYSDASLSGVSYLAFDNTGNVGIGTTAPSTIMEINKTFASGSEQHDWLRLKGTQGGAWYSGVGLEFYWKDTGNSAEWSHGRIYGIATSFDGAGNGGSCLIFQTKGHGAYANAPTEKMRITSDGRVGIGTASPAGLLDVRKAAEEHFLVRSGSDFGVGYSGIGLDSVNDAAAARKMMVLAGDPIVMLGGNVGVKMTPTYTLDVNGNCRISTGFGCNSKTPQTAYSVNAACSDLSTVVALCNQIRTALINNGICA